MIILKKISAFSFLILFLGFIKIGAFAQQNVKANNAANRDTTHFIRIIHADRTGYKKINDTTQINFASGHVIMKQQTTIIDCDSIASNSITSVTESFGHIHVNDNDSVQIYADYMRYQGIERKAFLKNNVKLSDSKSTLTTSQLDYDLNTHIAVYTLNGKLVTDSSILTSGAGTYYADTHDATFSKNVVLTDPQYVIKTDTLEYNTYFKKATFTVPTLITSGPNRTMNTTDGYWDLINKKGYFSKRPIIKDSASTLIADEVAVDDINGFGQARGNVVYKDTAQNIVVLCNDLKSNRENAAFLATVNPVMIVKQNDDSTFIAADTLYSARYDSTQLNKPNNEKNINPLEQSKENNAIKDSVIQQNTKSPENISLPENKMSYKKIGKTFVWQSDSLSNNIIAKPSADSVKQKEEKKGIFGLFRKKNQDTTKKTNNDNQITKETSGKKTPGVIDSLKNTQQLPIDSAAMKQVKPGVDLSHSNNLNQKDSMPAEDSRSRFIEAYYNVRIYNDSLQSVADSLYYDSRDSVFQLFRNPVLWTTSNRQISQIAGDTIYLYTANSKPKYMKVWNNAIMLSQADSLHNKKTSTYYNQMSGRTIEGWFTNGQIDSLKARGDAKSVFYMLDANNKYIGVNTQNSRTLDFYFLDKELNKIVGRNDVIGKTYPMRQVDHESLRLKGFQWLDDKRPKSKYELLAH